MKDNDDKLHTNAKVDITQLTRKGSRKLAIANTQDIYCLIQQEWHMENSSCQVGYKWIVNS